MRRATSGLRPVALIFAVGALLLVGKHWVDEVPESHPPTPAAVQMQRERGLPSDPGPPEVPGEIGVRALLGELVDLERLAILPDPPFRTYLASSYDRRSKSASDPVTWFANDDWVSTERPNYVRLEEVAGRREYVLLDVTGPGALVRIWSATPTGTLRVYLDGSSTPVIEEHLVDLLSGNGTIPRPFAYVAARGYNAYFPLPFRTTCKVTVDEIMATDPFQGGPLEKFYFQINYRIYPEAVRPLVRTFRKSDVDRLATEVSRVASVLLDGSRAYQPSPRRKIERLDRVGDSARSIIAEAHGGVIREVVLRVRHADEAALRRATLSWTFDEQVTVEAPLGDFFGTGPGASAYHSLPFSVGTDGSLVSRWPMPFQQRATLLIEHAPEVEGEISVEPWRWSAQSLYFNARWRPEAKVRTHPPRDLRLLDFEGEGAYVGTVFNLVNPSGARWWGEGDEKLYVDRETFPSHFGTGTEDYFGFAWATTERFDQALHAQTRADGPGFDGRFSMNRFHTLDRIPFTKALRFDLELWHWDDSEITWDAMVYYYARPGGAGDSIAPARGR
jgi:hypothetical protein